MTVVVTLRGKLEDSLPHVLITEELAENVNEARDIAGDSVFDTSQSPGANPTRKTSNGFGVVTGEKHSRNDHGDSTSASQRPIFWIMRLDPAH